jgi:Hemerythrin HHE cation binding domain
MVVIHRAMLGDLARLAAGIVSAEETSMPPARTGAVCRYASALLAAIGAYHKGEDDILWPVITAVAGASVDLAPLVDDHLAITAAAATTRRALAGLGAEPGAAGQLGAPVAALRGIVGEHIADEEAQVFPAMRRYLTAGAYRWCQREMRRKASMSDRMFIAGWLARYARPDELSRLLTAGGWQGRVLLAAARPAYGRLEHQAFGKNGEGV